MPAGGASLRRVRGRSAFDTSRSFLVEPGHQPSPACRRCAVESPFLRHSTPGCSVPRASGHRPRVELLHSNVSNRRARSVVLFSTQSRRRSASRAFSRAIASLVRCSAVGAALGAREASLRRRSLVRSPGVRLGACSSSPVDSAADTTTPRRHHHAAIEWRPDRVGDVREGDMPAPGPISRDAIGLHALRHGRLQRIDPPDLRYPYPPVTPGELLDMARLDPDLPKPSCTPVFATMDGDGTGEKLRMAWRIAQRLLLHLCTQPPTAYSARASVNCADCSLYPATARCQTAVAPRTFHTNRHRQAQPTCSRAQSPDIPQLPPPRNVWSPHEVGPARHSSSADRAGRFGGRRRRRSGRRAAQARAACPLVVLGRPGDFATPTW